MVSFVSLFLGLMVGYQTVTVQVTEPVAQVDLVLDGHRIATLKGPPWNRQIDLGQELAPHVLVAVAFDADGEELDRTEQWLNTPRAPAETHILLAVEDDGRRTARVTWESLVGAEPSAARVTFDGRELVVDDPHVIPLPPYDPEQLHFLRVDLEFGGFVASTAEVTFGGTYADQINTELTAVPVLLDGRKRLPPVEEMDTWFLSRDRPLRAAAVEKGQADLIVVRDRGAWNQLRRIRSQALTGPYTANTGLSQWFRSHHHAWKSWTFQFFWPVARRLHSTDSPYDLFTHSARYSAEGGSLHGWATTVEMPADLDGEQRLADAVAVAGVTAAGGNRRRGVLLILGDRVEDHSEAAAGVVRRYLERLRVPLFVWTVEGLAGGHHTEWGEGVDASTPQHMQRASRALFRELEQQRIFWLDGIHLPQDISLHPTVEGVRLVTSTQRPTLQQDEPILGTRSAIEIPPDTRETVRIEAGSRLREQPSSNTPILALFETVVVLPVMERQGLWVKVRHGSWQGWVVPDGRDSPVIESLVVRINPDEDLLVRARDLLGENVEERSLGPYALYSDVEDDELLQRLSAVAQQVPEAYRRRYGIDPGPQTTGVIVFFDREQDYRAFEVAEPRIALAHSQGYTSEALSLLYAGQRSEEEIVSVFVHELAHLLNRQLTDVAIPPWLEDGIAEDLAFSRIDRNGRLKLGTLATGSQHRAGPFTTIAGPEVQLHALVNAWRDPRRPTLNELLALPSDDFIARDSRAIHYSMSAFLIRYLLDGGDSDLRQGFLDYLQALFGSSLPDSVSLWEHLDTTPADVQTDLHLWLLGQASRHPLPVAGPGDR